MVRRLVSLGLLLALALLVVVGCGEETKNGVSTEQSASEDDALLDKAAMALARDALLVIESGYVDVKTFDPTILTPEVLGAVEPSTTFIVASSEKEALGASGGTAKAQSREVSYFGTGDGHYAVGTVSGSGKIFGVSVEDAPVGQLTFYVNGQPRDWDSLEAQAPAVSESATETGSGDGGATAQDEACQALVFEAKDVIERAYGRLGTFDAAIMTPEYLAEIDSSIEFHAAASMEAALAPGAEVVEGRVAYFGQEGIYAIGIRSGSGTVFGLTHDMERPGSYWMYVDGEEARWPGFFSE